MNDQDLILEFVKLRKTGVPRKKVLSQLHTSDKKIKDCFTKYPEIEKEYIRATKVGECNVAKHKADKKGELLLPVFMEQFRAGERRDDIIKSLNTSLGVIQRAMERHEEILKEYKELATYRMKHSGMTKTEAETREVIERFVSNYERLKHIKESLKEAHTTSAFVNSNISKYPELKERYLKVSPIVKKANTGRSTEEYKRIIESTIQEYRTSDKSIAKIVEDSGIAISNFRNKLKLFPNLQEEYKLLRAERIKNGVKDNRKLRSKAYTVKDSIVEMYRNKESIAKIAKTFKIGPSVIKKILAGQGISLRTQQELNNISSVNRCLIKTDEEWLSLYEEYKVDYNLDKVAKKHKTSSETVKKNFSRLHLPVKRVSNVTYKTNQGDFKRYDKDYWKSIYEYYMEHSEKDTLSYVGISQKSFNSILKIYGWKKRTRIEENEFSKSVESSKYLMKQLQELEEYELLDRFTGFTRDGLYKKYRIKHKPCGKVITRTLHDLGSIRCYHCYPKSRGENFIADYLASKVPIIRGDRQLIAPKEIDVIIPSLKVAIEYNGSYWHSSKWINKKAHSIKTQECLNKGYKLYHFWDYQDNNKIIDKLNQLMGLSKKVYARNTEVKEVSYQDKKEFFDNYHLSNDCTTSFALGLYRNEKMYACMSFRLNKDAIEIARYACKEGYTVVGGFSKLLKHSIELIKVKYPSVTTVISYCNRDITPDYHDSVYYKNGFTFIKDTGNIMSYYDSKKGKIVSREKFQKHKLKGTFLDYKGQNVREFLESKQIYEIHNSGNWKFERSINED